MKDLDFDELDKAVSSLMAGVPKTSDVPTDTEKTLTISSLDQPASSSVSTTAPTPPPVSPPTPSAPVTPSVSRPVAAPASRRAGRFMDVVRPQAPLKKPETPGKVSRQGASLSPISTNVGSTPAAMPSPAPSVPQIEPIKTPEGDWPDPLDMAGFPKSSPGKESGPKNEAVGLAEQTTAPPAESPLVSPFLPDTKVEKRPLGANAIANAGITEPTESQPEALSEDEADEQLPATLEDTKPILPEELHSDLVAIESDTTSPQKEEPSEQESSESWRSPDDPVAEPKKDTLTQEPPKPSIPISIPQQYKEETPTGEKENGAIYDTDSYHKPLAHPAKQKSGWMWVIWILLILIVGAGGGAALYFLRLV